MPATFTRGRLMGRGAVQVGIGADTFEALENYIRWAAMTRGKMPVAMDRLARLAATINMGAAQKRSAGPVDPQQNRPELAWRIPVRRITGRYYLGWKVRRQALGWWQLYNDSREAFYIEYGIHRNPRTGQVSARRIRRPIQKLSFMDTLRFMERTQVWHRVWANLVLPPPGKRRGKGFIWQMQSPITEAVPVIGPLGNRIPGLGRETMGRLT